MADEVLDTPVSAPAPAPEAAPVPQAKGSAPAPATTPAPSVQAPAAAPGVGEDKPGYWAADWRERLSGGDEKALKQLQRYGSPEDIWKKARNLEIERSSGKLKPVLGKDATPEEIAEYRKSWGIPDTPDKYDIAGAKLDDVDRPMMGEVMKALHAAHAPAEAVKAAVNAWATVKQQAQEFQAQADTKAKKDAEDTLRQDWGTDYRRNLNLVTQLLDGAGDEKIKDQILGGRLEDGTPFGSSPAAMKLLLGVALAQNPAGVVVSSGNGDVAGSLKEELKKISDFRTQHRSKYDKDTDMQEKERKYINAAIKSGLMNDSGVWIK